MRTLAKTALVLLLSFLAVACGDFLDIDPRDELSRAELLGTTEGAGAALLGVYHLLGNSTYQQFRYSLLADAPANL